MHVLLSHTMFTGSLFHRIAEPARAVAEAGLGVEVTVQRGLKTVMAPDRENPAGPLVVREVDAQGADVVVLQLPKTLEMLQCLRLLQAQGVAVVVEVDDHLTAVPPGHQGHDALIRKGIGRIAETCAREADFVTVSTPNLLALYGARGHGAMVPNAMPRRIAELPPAYEREPEIVTVGWTGTVGTHPYDLQTMESGLEHALDWTRGRSRFAILGQAGNAKELLRLTDEPIEMPWIMDVDGYSAAIGERFDIGVAPLRIDTFNNCKSWLKVLEYSARGVFSVRSPSAEYERLGLGYRAKRPRDWSAAIIRAVEGPDWRREQAAANREQVLARHLTEHTAELWAAAWRTAREIRTRTDRIGA
ncbi:glycosyltransferase family protein [Geodermatophilus marinus]|uniref:glycosyltransferase family protein n=1 Tax=Geodermatophilus sp. LHW52908 TaxID=2303986 RepID=UPI000E3C80BF|nr:glycosyltransferase [Geodermatophilus sp. LHW52908]RFU22882.1 glycosyltransferase family 1 protein [Geodermatophilus sp. LHW52908]